MSYPPQGSGGSGGGGAISREEITPGSLTLTGSYQDIISYTATAVKEVSGWIDLSNMAAGDTVVVQTLLNGSVHSLATYQNAQDMDLVYVTGRLISATDVFKVQVKQTAGTYRTISHKFYAG